MTQHFANREAAGDALAAHLVSQSIRTDVVVAVPNGGVVVGVRVARSMRVALQIVPVRKLRWSEIPIYGLGAVAPSGVLLNRDRISRLSVPQQQVDLCVAQGRRRITRFEILYGAHLAKSKSIGGQSVLVVDDGAATGYTLCAAIDDVMRLGAKCVVAAIPVASSEAVAQITPCVDSLHCLSVSSDVGFVVDAAYRDFGRVRHSESLRYLEESRDGYE